MIVQRGMRSYRTERPVCSDAADRSSLVVRRLPITLAALWSLASTKAAYTFRVVAALA
jgi:hypothetical protein